MTRSELRVTDVADEVSRLFRLTKAWRTLHTDPSRHPRAAAHLLLIPLANRGAMRSTALAECTHTDPSTISRHVALLLSDGLVTREADQADGRASLLVLTDAGRARVQEMRQGRDQMVAGLLDEWRPSEVADLARLLNRFNDAFEATLHDDEQRKDLETA